MIRMQTAVTRLEHTRVNAEVDFLETERLAQVHWHLYKGIHHVNYVKIPCTSLNTTLSNNS